MPCCLPGTKRVRRPLPPASLPCGCRGRYRPGRRACRVHGPRCHSLPLSFLTSVFAVPERAVSRHRGQLCRDGVFAVRVAIRLQCHGAGAGVVLPELDEVAARIAAVRGGAALHALIEVAHASPPITASSSSTFARTSGGYDRNVSTSGSSAKP